MLFGISFFLQAGLHGEHMPGGGDDGVLLSGKAGGGQVFGGGGTAHRQTQILAVLRLQGAVGGEDLSGQVCRQPATSSM